MADPYSFGGLTFDPATGKISGALQRKQIPGIGELLQDTFSSGALDRFRPSQGLLSQIQSSTAPVQGLGNDYFAGIQNQATERLKRQYFDQGGIRDQVAENAASRGLTGSGVEQGLFREQVYQPFAQGASDVASDVASQQAQYGMENERFNRQIGLQGAQLMSGIESQFNSLGAQFALAEQGRLSKEAEADLDRQLQQLEMSVNAYQQNQQSELTKKTFIADLISRMGSVTDPAQRNQLNFLLDAMSSGGDGQQAYKDFVAQGNPSGRGFEPLRDAVLGQFDSSQAFTQAHPEWTNFLRSGGSPDLNLRHLKGRFQQLINEEQARGVPSEMSVHEAYARLRREYGV